MQEEWIGVAVTFQTRIRTVLASELDQDISYLSWFTSVLFIFFRQCRDITLIRPRSRPSNSLIILQIDAVQSSY
jgi:hypothetical protein